MPPRRPGVEERSKMVGRRWQWGLVRRWGHEREEPSWIWGWILEQWGQWGQWEHRSEQSWVRRLKDSMNQLLGQISSFEQQAGSQGSRQVCFGRGTKNLLVQTRRWGHGRENENGLQGFQFKSSEHCSRSKVSKCCLKPWLMY